MLAKSTNAATQDADVNEASCFLSSLFRTRATHSLQRYTFMTIRYVSNLIIDQLRCGRFVSYFLHLKTVPSDGQLLPKLFSITESKR